MASSKGNQQKKEITFKGKKYKIGVGWRNRHTISSNFYRLFKLANGEYYAFDKISHEVYPYYR